MLPTQHRPTRLRDNSAPSQFKTNLLGARTTQRWRRIHSFRLEFAVLMCASFRSALSRRDFESLSVCRSDLLITTAYLTEWCLIFKIRQITMLKQIEDRTLRGGRSSPQYAITGLQKGQRK